MKKRASCLLVIMAAMTFAMTPRGAGSDYFFNSEEYPSYAVLLYALPSNAGYKWSKDFSGRPGAANGWPGNNIGAGAANHYAGFAAASDGGFGVTPEQACTVIIARNRGLRVRDNVGRPFMEMGRVERRGYFMPLDLTVQCRCAVRDGLIMTLRAGGGYTHDFSDEGTMGLMRYAGMGRTVVICDRTPDAENWGVNLGVKFDFRDRWEVGADYRYEGAESHGYTGSLANKF